MRQQYRLAQRLAERIADLRDRTAKSTFRQLVLDGGWTPAATPAYEFRFAKHYYPVVADLEDGGEEWSCAIAIDQHPAVARWVRNLDSDPVAGFWLPTSFGRFYPDFVCELADERLFVAEYKGGHIRDMPREIEKDQIGQAWAQASAGKRVFAMPFKSAAGSNVAQQIERALAKEKSSRPTSISRRCS